MPHSELPIRITALDEEDGCSERERNARTGKSNAVIIYSYSKETPTIHKYSIVSSFSLQQPRLLRSLIYCCSMKAEDDDFGIPAHCGLILWLL